MTKMPSDEHIRREAALEGESYEHERAEYEAGARKRKKRKKGGSSEGIKTRRRLDRPGRKRYQGGGAIGASPYGATPPQRMPTGGASPYGAMSAAPAMRSPLPAGGGMPPPPSGMPGIGGPGGLPPMQVRTPPQQMGGITPNMPAQGGNLGAGIMAGLASPAQNIRTAPEQMGGVTPNMQTIAPPPPPGAQAQPPLSPMGGVTPNMGTPAVGGPMPMGMMQQRTTPQQMQMPAGSGMGAATGAKRGGRIGRSSGGRTPNFHPGGEKGKLHREMGIPEGEKIGASRLASAAHSKNPEIRRDAIRAQTMSKWHHTGPKKD